MKINETMTEEMRSHRNIEEENSPNKLLENLDQAGVKIMFSEFYHELFMGVLKSV
jgi:hypothetical protein